MNQGNNHNVPLPENNPKDNGKKINQEWVDVIRICYQNYLYKKWWICHEISGLNRKRSL